MATLYPTIYASVLCLALIFVQTGESLDCSRTAEQEATSTRRQCLVSGAGGCGRAYKTAFSKHQRTCSFQVGRRSGGLATLLDESQDQISSDTEQWLDNKDFKFSSFVDRLWRAAAASDEEEQLPKWLQKQEKQGAKLDSQALVPRDSIQRLLGRL